MPLQFSITGNFTGSIFSGSYLGIQDTSLFSTTQSADIFFGYSDRDITELTIFDPLENQISWSLLNKEKKFNNITLSYIDSLNNLQSYTYRELSNQFITYRSEKILIAPINDLSSSGVFDGTFKLSYIFTRNMAGSMDDHLVINDISPSRTEIKLLPKGESSIAYAAFCVKKFPISDVSEILLAKTRNCPYDQIYKVMQKYSGSIQYSSSMQYSGSIPYLNGIQSLQTLFFLPNDSSIVTFFKNLYEDFVKYTNLSQGQIDAGFDPTRIYRIQGIRSYFNNYLLQEYNTIADFNDIEQKFDGFVKSRIEQAFSQYKGQNSRNYIDAKNFCYDFFAKFFYSEFITTIQKMHQEKYFAFFKDRK